MSRVRTLLLVVLLLSYGAVGARQPAVRTSVPLGVDVHRLATALDIAAPDRSRLLLDIVRVSFAAPDGQDATEAALRTRLQSLFRTGTEDARATVPLPLDPSVWRDTILGRQVPDARLIGAIFSDRSTALLYHGLAALDDETLAVLGPDRETLDALRRHAGAFATFGRALRIHAGRVEVPGGADAEPLWQALVGVEPDRPGPFVRRLFAARSGRLAFFFDALSQLDVPHQLFATGRALPKAARLERLRALLDVFEHAAPSWRPEDRPFMRPVFDPSLTLSLVDVSPGGELALPFSPALLGRIFRGDDVADPPFAPIVAGDLARDDDRGRVDAAWVASRVHRPTFAVGRRRLEAILFAQRLAASAPDGEVAASAVLGFMAFPALQLTLERMGDIAPSLMVRAALRARTLDDIREPRVRQQATLQFQAVVAILDRMAQHRGLAPPAVSAALSSLLALDPTPGGYGPGLAAWLRGELLPLLAPGADEAADPIEDSLLTAMAGPVRPAGAVVSWEGREYHVDPAYAELRRLRAVREKQGGLTLGAALALVEPVQVPASRVAVRHAPDGAVQAEGSLSETLTAILYAAYLGDPEGMALRGGNVALRHDPGFASSPGGAWRLPTEILGGRGSWHVTGSLLGLDAALARLALHRLDSTAMPEASRVSATLRQSAAVTAALLNPWLLTDAARDEIAAALGRGRARLAALRADRGDIDRFAREAGLSEWRREALGWTMTHDPGRAASALSLVELFWLGAPRPSDAAPLDPWGAATLPLTGCLCLRMPRPRPWEHLAGRPAQGLLATRAADVALRVAERLAAHRMPAALAPGIVGLAMQDALEGARPAYFDDWSGFTGVVASLSAERMDDYVAAQTGAGPLVPLPRANPSPSR